MSDDEDEQPAKKGKKKPEKYELVPEDDPAWKTLRDLIAKHHTELAQASIALVWEFDVPKDKDGNVVLGRAKKVSPLEKKFRTHDFTILLNAKVWSDLPAKPKRALLDHELSHCTADENDEGELVYRLRRHDLEEFNDVVRRHGLWREKVQSFVDAALKKNQPAELFPISVESASKEGE